MTLPLRPLFLLPMLLSCLVACSRSDAEPQRPAAPAGASVEVMAVRTGPVERTWSALGSLKANESVIVRPEIAGRISRIGFEEGQRVSRGVPLFELDDSVFLAHVAQAQASLVLSASNARRSREPFDRGLISASDRDSVKASQDLNEASLRLARAQAAKAVLSAPFAGRAGLRGAAVGDYVNPGQDLVVLEDLDRMKLEFRLPELAMPDIAVGQAVDVEPDAYPGEKFRAQLYALDSRVATTRVRSAHARCWTTRTAACGRACSRA